MSSIHATLLEPPPLPIASMVGAIDVEARATVERARDAGVPAFRGVEPSYSGRLRAGTTGRIGKTVSGFSLTIGPTARVRYPSGVSAREVFRFVDKGTGVFGRKGAPIRPRRAKVFALPGGFEAESVRGQRPQSILLRGEAAADPLVSRELEDGADRAARRAERTL